MFPTFSFWLSLLLAFNFIQNTITTTLGNKTDNLALLKFKDAISNDPYGILASWNSSTHYWEIPANLTSCSELEFLYLSGNHLIGKIPIGISSLHKLLLLEVTNNNLTGRIPSFIGNLSSLSIISMDMNHVEADIPQEMCSLKNLKKITVSINRLSGTFRSCLYNLSSLTIISATLNDFNGSLPSNMFNTLSNLKEFYFGGNQFSGTIPISIANASALQKLDLSGNNLVGQVPSLGKLHDLQWLNLEGNYLDFGIARLVSVIDDKSHQETSTIGMKGTIGYAPPEYGMGSEISTYGLACSMESPKERMNIVDVIRELDIIKKAFLAGVRTRD
ncbi:non-specific serine/threonine protein kinase [Trifolium repens]|nr:non-specific serine/threonine protein kinase [Trifolium repens]